MVSLIIDYRHISYKFVGKYYIHLHIARRQLLIKSKTQGLVFCPYLATLLYPFRTRDPFVYKHNTPAQAPQSAFLVSAGHRARLGPGIGLVPTDWRKANAVRAYSATAGDGGLCFAAAR
jgi:hypothetical protein